MHVFLFIHKCALDFVGLLKDFDLCSCGSMHVLMDLLSISFYTCAYGLVV
jgi:hypothetical protein